MNKAKEIPSAKETDEILSAKRTARILELTDHTLRKWRQLGIGPEYIRISARCVRYKREDVMRWLEARRVQPPDAKAGGAQ